MDWTRNDFQIFDRIPAIRYSNSMHPEKLQSPESHDQVKALLQKRHRAILGRQLVPADIDTFADRAIEELIALAKEATESYAREKELVIEGDKRKDFEDEAFQYYGLQSVSDLLEKAQEKLEVMQEISRFTAEHLNWEHLKTVITPPEKQRSGLEPGNGEFAHDMIPRLKTMLFILRERGVALERVTLMDGIVTPDMVRQTSYATLVIPEINRLAQVCDEEGNASYIFKLSGINVEAINRMTKPEKQELIVRQPGIGVRFKQGPNWREKAEFYLFEEIPTEQNEARTAVPLGERPLMPLYGELDSWSGFAVDEESRHWGIRAAIAKKLGKGYVIFRKRIHDARLETRSMLDALDRVQTGYCFEQLTELFPELVTGKPVEKEGEWRGFWTDPQTGNHWATGGGLMRKFGVNDWKTIKRYAEENNLPSIKITDAAGRQADAYCYEAFLALESFMEFLTAPQVEKDGIWTGYLMDGEGKHWAPVGVLADHFKTTDHTINRYAKEANLHTKKVRTKYGEVTTAFRLEDFEANSDFMAFLTIPRVEKEGEWAGFLADEKSNHWGAQWRIAQKLNVSEGTVHRLVAKHPELPSRLVKDMRGKVHPGFCYEEIRGVMI